jgi:hypothetical protein
MQTENTHGGKRKGAGAKKKYGEETTTLSFRCPVSQKENLKKIVKGELEKLEKTNKK